VSPLSYNKACNLEDFAQPDLRAVMRRELPHEVARFGDAYPAGHEDRKDWETAMAIRAFEDHGLLDGERDFLGVAAGSEPLIFCLTRYAHRVFATDLYLDSGLWAPNAPESMLKDPGSYWPSKWNPRRLVLQHMNALQLHHEDETFDGVFSSSSIEHFGDYAEIHQAMDEIFRVLRPGGIAAFATEYRISGPPPGIAGTLMFDEDDIAEHLIGQRDWGPLSPLDLTVSDATIDGVIDAEAWVKDLDSQIERDGAWYSFRVEYATYPVVALRYRDGRLATTMQLALRKGSARRGRKKLRQRRRA
jgi:SAM-dependent methyltransferase